MNPLRKIAKQAYRQLLTFRGMSELRRMESDGNHSSRLLAEALREAFTGVLTPEERAWVKKIEALRGRLDASLEPITIVDYGAGNADGSRTEAEMERGTVHHVTVGDVSKISKYEIWVLMLFKLIRKFQPNVSLELGAAVGISAAYQAAALYLNRKGQVVTLEGAPSLAALTGSNLHNLGLENFVVIEGRFQDTIGDTLQRYQPIDCAFIDGHHNGKAMLGYFEQIYPYLGECAVLIFDDIYYYASMREAWNTLEADSRVLVSVDLSRMGVCVVDKRAHNKAIYKLPMI